MKDDKFAIHYFILCEVLWKKVDYDKQLSALLFWYWPVTLADPTASQGSYCIPCWTPVPPGTPFLSHSELASLRNFTHFLHV